MTKLGKSEPRPQNEVKCECKSQNIGLKTMFGVEKGDKGQNCHFWQLRDP